MEIHPWRPAKGKRKKEPGNEAAKKKWYLGSFFLPVPLLFKTLGTSLGSGVKRFPI